MNKIMRFCFSLFISCFLLFSCEKPNILLNQPNEDVRSLGGFIGNNFDYELLTAALEYTGLMDTLLNSPGPFTVLAPDDNAFNELGINRASDFLRLDRDSLRYVLQYHIIPGRLMEADIPQDMADLRYSTLAGMQLYASRAVYTPPNRTSVSHLYFSGCYADSKDQVLSNGVMHTLDKVMKPFPGVSVQEWLTARSQYSTFVAGLKKFHLWDELSGEVPSTIFAVQNSTLAEWGITAESIATMDEDKYVGDRLFGPYVFLDRHYFIHDINFFYWAEGQEWSVTPLRNDSSYYRILMGRLDHGAGPSLVDYTLAVSWQTLPYSYDYTPGNGQKFIFNQANFMGSAAQVYTAYNAGRYRAWNDNLCENGVVHDLQGVLVLPDEALKTE